MKGSHGPNPLPASCREETSRATASTHLEALPSSSLPSPLIASQSVPLKDGRSAALREVERSDGQLLYEHLMSMSDESRRLFCPYPFDRQQAEAIAADTHNSQSLRLIALVEGKPAGYAYFTTRNAKNGFPMVGIGVTDEFQGVGLGRALMNHLIREAIRRRCRGLDLNVFKNNYRAQRLYASLGFFFTGEADWGRQYSMRLWFAKDRPAEDK